MQYSYSYYVLDNISTCPILVPLEDYCRHKNVKKEDIKTTWPSIEQNQATPCIAEDESIKVYYNIDYWKSINLKNP